MSVLRRIVKSRLREIRVGDEVMYLRQIGLPEIRQLAKYEGEDAIADALPGLIADVLCNEDGSPLGESAEAVSILPDDVFSALADAYTAMTTEAAKRLEEVGAKASGKSQSGESSGSG